MNYNNPQEAFEKAIEKGILSDNENSHHYAGNYMYMGTDDNGKDLFKHIDSRLYA